MSSSSPPPSALSFAERVLQRKGGKLKREVKKAILTEPSVVSIVSTERSILHLEIDMKQHQEIDPQLQLLRQRLIQKCKEVGVSIQSSELWFTPNHGKNDEDKRSESPSSSSSSSSPSSSRIVRLGNESVTWHINASKITHLRTTEKEDKEQTRYRIEVHLVSGESVSFSATDKELFDDVLDRLYKAMEPV